MLHVEEVGAGERVVLLHSSGLSSRQWKRLMPLIAAQGFSAASVDLTGHGASEPLPANMPFTFRTDVERVAEMLLAGEPAHVVGHSYGGFIALQAALAAPKSIRTLTAYDPVAFGVLGGRAAVDADAREELTKVAVSWGTTDEDHERWLTAFVDYWGGTGAWAALREEARAEFRRVGWVVEEGVRTLGQDMTPASAYAGLEFPVDFISGEKSPLAASRTIANLKGAIRNARISIVPGAGHMGPLTHADAVNAIILAALARGDART